jgi:RNA recognition motif-containing protein
MAIGTTRYVGNLSYGTSDQALRAAFEEDGPKVVEVKIVAERDTGQPRGFAFVEMAARPRPPRPSKRWTAESWMGAR